MNPTSRKSPSRNLLMIISTAAILALLPSAKTLAQQEDTPDLPPLFTMSIEQLMELQATTASRKAERIDLAPNVMYVITRNQIRRRGYRTISDVLQTIPGFAVFHRDLQYVVKVRGIAPNENEKVTFMLNGHPINQLTEPEILVGPLLLDIVERIEIIVGPGAVLYGAETLGAIVNLITRQPDYREMIVSAGNYDTFSGSAVIGEKWAEDRHFMLSATWMRRDGWDAWSASDRPGLSGRTDTGRLNPSTFLYGQAQLGSWHFQASSYNAHMPELNLLEGGISSANRDDYMDSLLARKETEINDRWSTYTEFNYDNRRMLRAATADNGSGHDLSQTSYRSHLAARFHSGAHYLQAGIQAGYHQNRHNYNFRWNPQDPAYDNSSLQALVKIEDTHDYGFYISEEYQLMPALRLVAACRADANSVLEDSDIYFSPRAAAIWHPNDIWISKIMHNTSRRFPSPWMSPMNELWGAKNTAPNYFINQPADQPESLSTWEWQNIFYLGAARISLNIYHQKLRNYIAWFRPFTNAGDFKGTGGELDLRMQVSRYLNFFANGAYNDADFEQTALSPPIPMVAANDDGEMAAVARYTANAGIDAFLRDNLHASAILRYFTRQPAFFNDKDSWGYVDDHVTLDGALAWENLAGGSLDLILTGRNLLDNRDEVAAPFHSYNYKPRGTSVEISVYYRF